MALNKREKILAVVAAGSVLLWLVLPMLRAIFVAPVESSRQRLAAVSADLDASTVQAAKITQAGRTLKEWRGRSLPADPLDAQRLYQAWLTDLVQIAEFRNAKVTPGRRVPKGTVFTGIPVTVEAEADLARLSRFLFLFHRADLAQRVASLKIESTGDSGNPPLTIALTAEGLSVGGASQRQLLFPQTTLAAPFQSRTDEQAIEVAVAAGFPAKPEFRIRIGGEYLTVTAMTGEKWTVRGGADSTRPARHEAGAIVELAPIHPDYAGRSLDDYRRLVEHSPFVKPSPKSAPSSPAPVDGAATVSDRAAETYLGASIRQDGVPRAWLYHRTSAERTLLTEGAELKIGDFTAVVVAIKPDHVVLRQANMLWKLPLGETLRSMQKLTDERSRAEGTEPGAK